MPKPDRYTLGLDIGMASVGAALLACDHIIALFVRTFDKAETAKEGESLNKIRRDARLTRRRIRRRAHRLAASLPPIRFGALSASKRETVCQHEAALGGKKIAGKKGGCRADAAFLSRNFTRKPASSLAGSGFSSC
ncbi:MAG: hypothetical protein L6364_09065 [Desulfobulbaceae bacterium]|jgi:hypothetical protein|nr:hypothetical protein [Desulfobulbaceae bacterium]